MEPTVWYFSQTTLFFIVAFICSCWASVLTKWIATPFMKLSESLFFSNATILFAMTNTYNVKRAMIPNCFKKHEMDSVYCFLRQRIVWFWQRYQGLGFGLVLVLNFVVSLTPYNAKLVSINHFTTFLYIYFTNTSNNIVSSTENPSENLSKRPIKSL